VSAFRVAAVIIFLAASILSHSEVVATGPCDGAKPALETISEALDEGRWDDAEQSVLPLELSHPECGQVIVALARLRAAQGESAEAERLFSRALTLAPDDAVAHALFARFQLSRGLGPQAAYLAAQALAIDADCSEALVVHGRILGQRGLQGEARAALERAVALDPTSAEAHHELGSWFFLVNLRDHAVRQFEAAITLNPQSARSHGYLAVSLEMLGRDEPAERAYRTAFQLQAKGGPFFDPALDYNYGRFLLKQGRFEESQTHLDRAVALHPGRRGPRHQRAKLYLARGDNESARTDAERALALGKPGDLVLDLQVYYLLATIYSRLGEKELAEKYADLARTTEIPDQADDLRRR
jgi:tetratricopeptide (TPR) repeat protein